MSLRKYLEKPTAKTTTQSAGWSPKSWRKLISRTTINEPKPAALARHVHPRRLRP